MSMKRIRWGQVGGGNDAFIGAVHRIASRIDNQYELVAGAFSSTAEKSSASAAALGVSPDRAYGSYEEMAEKEAAREDGIEAVSIVTPNHLHYPVAKVFLEHGIHVICDKPLTSTLEDALKLRDTVEKARRENGALFIITYNYSAYPLIRQAREMVQNGELGDIRLVQVEYAQDWLSTAVETQGVKQAEWRTDPARSGGGGAIGDIGTHAFQLAGFVSGLKAQSLLADLQSFGEGRALDDNAHILLRYEGNASGMLWCSQVAPGNENALRLRVYGTRGGLEWAQENPNILTYSPLGKPARTLTRAGAGQNDSVATLTRTPPGHPEGYLEGFANIYSEAATAIRNAANVDALSDGVLCPDIDAGVRGIKFVDAAVRSSKANCSWVQL